MASPPFDISITDPADNAIVSQHPAQARQFRDIVESWIKVEHNVQGRHDKVSLDDQNADLTIATDVVGIWNKDGQLRTRNGAGSVTNIPMDSSLLAPLADPEFTGNPKAPTPTAGDNDTSIATTAFVNTALLAQPPVPGQFKNLVIQNNSGTPNTQVDVDADYVTVRVPAGATYRLESVNLTIDASTTGANALDAGGLANNTWYAVFVIYNPGTSTVAGLLSTSGTSPTLPSGYTALSRFGWMRTDGSAHFKKTKQVDKQARYVISSGVQLPNITGSAEGTWDIQTPTYAAISVSDFVPTTASHISLNLSNWRNQGGSGVTNVAVAPNSNYNGIGGAVPPYFSLSSGGNGQVLTGSMPLESSNIYVVSSANTTNVNAEGWTDSI